jgi:hypothetical protein
MDIILINIISFKKLFYKLEIESHMTLINKILI